MIPKLRMIWSIFDVSERRRALFMLLMVVLMAGAETLGVLSIMPFLSVLGRPDIIHENSFLIAISRWLDVADSRDFIVMLGMASVFIVVVSSLFKTVTLHLVNRFVHMERHSLSTRLLSRYLQQPYEYFLLHNPSQLAKNVLSEVDQLVFDVIQPLSQMLAQGAVVLAMTLLIFWYDPLMAAGIVLVVGALYGAIYTVVRKRLAHVGRERQAADGQRYQLCLEVLGGIKDVKVTHASQAYLKAFKRASHEFSRHGATGETLSHSPLYLVEAAGYSGLIIIALLLLLRSGDIAHVLPALGLYGFAAYRMLPAVQIIYRGFARLRFASAALDSIHHDLHLPEESIPESNEVFHLQHEIRLQGIRYAYPSAPDKPVLDGLDLVIPANTSVGIVGPSGAGKSTLMDILLGLLWPQAGTMTVDGVLITRDNVAAWQRSIGYVPQHIYIADASALENIALGFKTNEIDNDAATRAAKTAQIHNFISTKLDRGYSSPLGDRGIRLSGGQRQRIGIARALYRDPALLFMDEATSALDSQTEEDITEILTSATGEKTIILITHRQASLRCAGKILEIHPPGAPHED